MLPSPIRFSHRFPRIKFVSSDFLLSITTHIFATLLLKYLYIYVSAVINYGPRCVHLIVYDCFYRVICICIVSYCIVLSLFLYPKKYKCSTCLVGRYYFLGTYNVLCCSCMFLAKGWYT